MMLIDSTTIQRIRGSCGLFTVMQCVLKAKRQTWMAGAPQGCLEALCRLSGYLRT